jgi:hypothetical protein
MEEPGGGIKQYRRVDMITERTPQAGYRRERVLGGRLRGSHRLEGDLKGLWSAVENLLAAGRESMNVVTMPPSTSGGRLMDATEEAITELARRHALSEGQCDFIRRYLIEDAQRQVGVPLIDALEAVWAAKCGDENDLRGTMSESNLCADCGLDTAPGCLDRREMEAAVKALGSGWKKGEGVPQSVGHDTEKYFVRDVIWEKAGMTPWGGCLCIGCLEKRLGRRLKPKDFDRDHPFNSMPGTPRLLNRRDRAYKGEFIIEYGPRQFAAHANSDECLGVFETKDAAGEALCKHKYRRVA